MTDKTTPASAKDAATKKAAKASVTEAIGKLIGDDALRERGAADREASEKDASKRTGK